MVIICKEIYQILTAILMPFSTCHMWFLGIMLPKVLYVQCFNNLLQTPLNPSVYPNDKFLIRRKMSKLVYNTFNLVTQCLQDQFQEAIQKVYFAELGNPY